ncbi:MAG: hypothetical protein H7A41_07780 [Chlamydiales bacterium]|nr:hypothetical protein [Chlamydiales bacterium]
MKRTFPIEKGFQVVIFFLIEFWLSFLKDIMITRGIINREKLTPNDFEKASAEDQKKDSILAGNNFVFSTVCGDPAGPGDYFEEVVEKRMNISSTKQHQGLIINEELLFQLAIDFCCYFNDKFERYGKKCKRKGSLNFTINWLEDMRKHPENHKTEWEIWEKTIEYVNSPGDKHLIF